CTIFTVMESPLQKGVIWVGSDDGLIHVTKDGGKNWSNVTPKEIPEWIQINSIEASSFDAGTAYAAATMYKFDDYHPDLYKTTDYGKSWRKITNGIPEGDFSRVIREDPNVRGLLYAGTETGVYVSFDDGEHWQSLQLNLPAVPISDLAVHKGERDLVAATQGRSFWILDDLGVLYQMTDAAKTDLYLFKPEDTYRMAGAGGFRPPAAAVGANPPSGAVLYFWSKGKPKGEVQIEILDASGKQVREFKFGSRTENRPAEGGSAAPQQDEEGNPRSSEPRLNLEAGLNRFVWDLRYKPATTFPGMVLWAGET